MRSFFNKLFLIVTLMLGSSSFADPIDKNFSGATFDTGFYFGQGSVAANGSPGLAWFLFVEPGYGLAIDTWNRFEGSFELGKGEVRFSQKLHGTSYKKTFNVNGQFLIKGGYGYSLSNHVFAVWRLAAGSAFGDIDTKDGRKGDNANAFSGGLGMDIVIPTTENIYLKAGAHLRFMSVSADNQDNFQLNLPLVNLGIRFLM